MGEAINYIIEYLNNDNTILENVYYVLGIISGIFVVLGLLFAIFQYKKQRKLNSVSNAIETATKFEREVVDCISLILLKFRENSEISKLVNDKEEKIRNAKQFNRTEMYEIFTDKEYNNYYKFICDTIIKINGKEKQLGSLMSETLNKLECYSIGFNKGIADEEKVKVEESLQERIASNKTTNDNN